MKIASDTTSTIVDATPSGGAAAHTGRASGALTAFGALAALVGSACSGGSETNASTTSERPTTTVGTTTPVTTIDSTTTIVVETTTTVDAPTVVSFRTDTPAGRWSSVSLLLTGRTATVEDDGMITFDLSEPSRPIDEGFVDETLTSKLTALGFWDYFVSIKPNGRDFWQFAREIEGGAPVIAIDLEELRALAATYSQTGGAFNSWVALASEANVPVKVIELCVGFQNSEGKVRPESPQAILLDVSDGIGKIAGITPYADIDAAGNPVELSKSPVSGLSC